MSDLTTQYLYKTAFNLTLSDAQSKQIAQIISAVSESVEQYLDRTLETTTYKAWYDGTGTPYIVLPFWPVTALYGASVCSSTALQIKNTSAKYAAASTESTLLRLFSVDSSGTETDTELAYSTYKTISDLHTAIEAVSGWSATTLTDMGSFPTSLIRPNQSQYAISPVTADIEIADEFENIRITADTNRVIERTYGTAFPEGLSNVMVWYKAGYTLPVDNTGHTALSTAGNLPAGLVQIINSIVKAVADASGQTVGGMQSESIGDYSYSIAPGAMGIISMMLEENDVALTPYRRLCA